MADEKASNPAAKSKTKDVTRATMRVPLLPNVTPDSWRKVMLGRPAGVSPADWQKLSLVIVENQAGRPISSARVKEAIAVASRAGTSDNIKAILASAETRALALEATESGRAEIASAKPIEWAHHGAPQRAPTAESAPGPAAVKPKVASAPEGKKPHPQEGAGGEKAAYDKIAAAVQAGRGKTFTYGKLNFAHEVARRTGDAKMASSIAAVMKEVRPYAPGPGRYGVSDSEYKNYAAVEDALGESDKIAIPEPALRTALGTARKYGHLETASLIEEHLPRIAVASKAAPAKSARASALTAAAPAKPVVAKVEVGPPPPDVPAEAWAKIPRPVHSTVADWRVFARVLYLVTEKGQLATPAEFRQAVKVAEVEKIPRTARVMRALALEPGAPVEALVEARTISLTGKKPQRRAAEAIGVLVIKNASATGTKSDLEAAIKVANEMGYKKTGTELSARLAGKHPGMHPAFGGKERLAAAGKPAPVAKPVAPAAASRVKVSPRAEHVAAAPGRTPVKPEGGKVPPIFTSPPGFVPKGLTEPEWKFFLATANGINSGANVPIGDIERARAIADHGGYKEISGKLQAIIDERRQLAARGRPADRSASPGHDARRAPPSPTVLASVPVTPGKAVVTDQATKVGVPAPVVAKIIVEAKGGNAGAQKIVSQAAETMQAASAGDKGAQDQIATWQAGAKAGNPAAQQAIAGVAAASVLTVAAASGEKPTQAPRRPVEALRAPPIPHPTAVAEVRRTPPAALVTAAAAGAGVSAAAVAAKVLAAKGGDEKAQAEMRDGAVLAERLADGDPAARQEVAALRSKSKGGDKGATLKLTGVAAAAATQAEIRRDMAQASIAGPPPEGNAGIAVAGIGAAGMLLYAFTRKKRKAA